MWVIYATHSFKTNMFWESDCITAKGHSNQCLLHGLPLFPLLNLYQHLILCNWGRLHYQWQAGDNWPFNFCFLLLIWCLAPFQYKTLSFSRSSPNLSQKNNDLELIYRWIVMKFEHHVYNPIPKILTVGNFVIIFELREIPFAS